MRRTARAGNFPARRVLVAVENLLTEKLLIESGGWPVFKQARALHERGAVLAAAWEPPLLQGRVREGEREYRAGLKIASRIRVDNLCTCRVSTGAGLICAHSLAVGLAVLQPAAPVAATGENPKSQAPNSKAEPGAATASLPFVEKPDAASRLRVVLPPNLAAAWAKGQIVLGLEMGEGSRPPILLDAALAKTRPLPVRPGDFAVLAGLSGALGGEMPRGVNVLDRRTFARVLTLLRGHADVSLGRTTALTLPTEPFRPVLAVTGTPDGGRVKIAVRWPTDGDDKDAQPLLSSDSGEAGTVGAFLLRPAARELVAVAPGLPAPYTPLLGEAGVTLGPAEADAFLAGEWPKLAGWFGELRDERPAAAADLKFQISNLKSPVELPANASPPKTFALDVEGSLNELTARLEAVYQTLGDEWSAAIGVTAAAASPRMPPGARRDPAAEDLALARLLGGGFSRPDPKTGRLVLRGQENVLRFFAITLPGLQRDWRVTVGARFTHVTRDVATVVPRVEVRGGSGTDWFELDLSMTVPGRDGRPAQTFSPAEIRRLLQTGRSTVRLHDGRLAVLPAGELDDLSAVLRDIEPDQRRPGTYRVKKFHAGYLDAALERFGPDTLEGWERWKTGAGALVNPTLPQLPGNLAETLRPYQTEGVRWLHFLAANNLGGILADEMGLGKTLQALAFLASLEDRAGAPALVVCPSSLLENWRREAARFTPGLRTLILHGPDRTRAFKEIARADLVITSYALLRRDVERYGNTEWAAAVLDEAHHVKNPDSQSAAAACALRARHRVVLTGTPLENSVRDLWSIMRFALPGYLGIRQDFRERYELPLSRPGDPLAADARERLARRMRPFLLRRRKQDVAKELPDKIEQVAYCELTDAQREVYRGLLAAGRQKIEEAMMDEKNPGRGRMSVLTALLRLRQACCDLRLLGLKDDVSAVAEDDGDGGEPGDATPETSAKLGLLNELLEEIREGGHRVLIFSQFVSMLRLLSAHFEAAGVPFSYLDGQTKDRAGAVDRFQNDPAVTAFLISTKAGGVGLNLTAADTVIHFDPWWNPAVEAQATDRAHRIGQERVVTAYKLIARGTVEDKILELQRRKRETTDALLDPETGGGSAAGDGLNLEEMRALMAE